MLSGCGQNVDSVHNLRDLKTGGKGDGKVCTQDMTPPVFGAPLFRLSGGGAEWRDGPCK